MARMLRSLPSPFQRWRMAYVLFFSLVALTGHCQHSKGPDWLDVLSISCQRSACSQGLVSEHSERSWVQMKYRIKINPSQLLVWKFWDFLLSFLMTTFLPRCRREVLFDFQNSLLFNQFFKLSQYVGAHDFVQHLYYKIRSLIAMILNAEHSMGLCTDYWSKGRIVESHSYSYESWRSHLA